MKKLELWEVDYCPGEAHYSMNCVCEWRRDGCRYWFKDMGWEQLSVALADSQSVSSFNWQVHTTSRSLNVPYVTIDSVQRWLGMKEKFTSVYQPDIKAFSSLQRWEFREIGHQLVFITTFPSKLLQWKNNSMDSGLIKENKNLCCYL